MSTEMVIIELLTGFGLLIIGGVMGFFIGLFVERWYTIQDENTIQKNKY